MRRPLTFIALFAVGAFVMFAFETTLTLLFGMTLQVAAIVLGVFTIATPEFLTADAAPDATADAAPDATADASADDAGKPAPTPLAVGEEDADEGGRADPQ